MIKWIGLILLATALGWAVAGLVTWSSWNFRIEDRAFICNDSIAPFASFETRISDHANAGDRLGKGWTWEAILREQRWHRIMHKALWFLTGTGILLLARSSQSPWMNNPAHAAPSAAPHDAPEIPRGGSEATEGPPSASCIIREIAYSRATLQIAALATLFLTACAPQQRALPPAPVVGKQVDTEAEAVAVVLADVQSRGGDPRKEECSAKLMDGNWHVVAWHILYPDNAGSSRFVPGGFTLYVVSIDGRIIKTLPGE